MAEHLTALAQTVGPFVSFAIAFCAIYAAVIVTFTKKRLGVSFHVVFLATVLVAAHAHLLGGDIVLGTIELFLGVPAVVAGLLVAHRSRDTGETRASLA